MTTFSGTFLRLNFRLKSASRSSLSEMMYQNIADRHRHIRNIRKFLLNMADRNVLFRFLYMSVVIVLCQRGFLCLLVQAFAGVDTAFLYLYLDT